VLLVSLGSNYTIFSVGCIWDEARRRPLPQALAVAVPRSTHAITAAGAFLVRSLLVPALISLVGRVSGWPGQRLAKRPLGLGGLEVLNKIRQQ
jgi:RND superfamily putative drug exporter